ncbi:MAG: glycosyltransferase family 39 protein [Candidatus Pacebacteria bacterium]|nr:glycosyltransferase family 39 protein [Candidatus Paceibacterota bacterium]
MNNTKKILIAILVVAAFLRIGWLSQGDTLNDEVFYAFRAIGLMDFDEAQMQTTPLEWFDPNVPSWTKLSFHDAPPLVFWIQNISMNIFGESNFGFRISSALFGIASVYLIYLIGSLLFSKRAGLLAAVVSAVTVSSVQISRVGMLESYLIFFMLLAVYFFIRALKEDKYLIWTGVAIGLGLLTKYNMFILIPAFFTYLVFYKREYFLNKKLWLGALLALVIFSPVIIYNIQLYRAVGHFDFQISIMAGQNPQEWKDMPGKQIGTLGERLTFLIPRALMTFSWLFLAVFALSKISIAVSVFRNFRETFKKYALHFFVLFWLVILLVFFIGTFYRFLVMLSPFMALAIGAALDSVGNKVAEKTGYVFLALFLGFEMFYSVNNQLLYYPVGPTPWIANDIRQQNYNWGYNELGDYFQKELEGKMPALTFDFKYKFLNDIRDKALADGEKQNLEIYPALIVFGGNIQRGAKLWVLDRLHIYHAWPIISADTYFQYMKENGADFYNQAGFKDIYFIFPSNSIPTPELSQLMKGEQASILNKRNEEAFKIYKFTPNL